jgi:hypothetical protein
MPIVNKVFVCLFSISCFFPVNSWSLINDPTKPIYSENVSSRVVTAPVIKEKKVLLLQSIFYSSKNKTAVINGRVFAEGEYFDGMLLHHISKKQVIVKYKKKEIELIVSQKVYIDKDTGESSEE